MVTRTASVPSVSMLSRDFTTPVTGLNSLTNRRSVRSGHRSRSPERTLRRFVRLLSPVTGVVKSLESIETDGTDAVRVTIASYGGPSPGDGLDAVREHLRRQSSGKGATDAQARCSGLGE